MSIRSLLSLKNSIYRFPFKREISLCNCHQKAAYEGDGKTTVNILNQEQDTNLMINGFSQVGFRLNNGMTILGPMVIFPRSVLSWTVADLNDVTEESLSLFFVLEPKLDLLILGVGDKLDDLTFHKRIYPVIKSKQFNLEILPTESACATFNFLNFEGRHVGAALLPPKTMKLTDDDLMRSKMRYQNLYERE